MSKGCGMGPAAPRPTGAAMARRRAPGLGSAAASCSRLDASASAPLHGAAAATAAAAAAAAPRSGSAAARWNRGKRDRRSGRGRSSLPPRLCLALLSLTLAALLPSAARAQQEICSCVPTRYTFELDLAAVCPPPGVTVGDDAGIDRFFCRTDVVESDPDSPEDLVPVSISSYIVLELDQELEVMKQFFRGDLDLGQGDTFEYVSVTDRADVGPGDIPGALQMSLTGRNAAGDQITAQWIITFTNLCDVMALSEGDFMSWAKFVSRPFQPLCCLCLALVVHSWCTRGALVLIDFVPASNPLLAMSSPWPLHIPP